MSILVLKAGDIELNSGPNKKSHSYFSCCHWNVNSSPTWNSYLIDIVKLQHGVIIKGYNLIRSDHPSNIKRGGVGIVCITKSRSTHCKHHIFNWMPSLWSCNKKQKKDMLLLRIGLLAKTFLNFILFIWFGRLA